LMTLLSVSQITVIEPFARLSMVIT
jgi:hypothetical protein